MKLILIILIFGTSSMAFVVGKQQDSFHREGTELSEQSSLKTKKHHLQIERETGLDGKVRAIRLDNSDDAPGVRVYGIPKNKLIDSRRIEKSEPKPVLRGDPRGGGKVGDDINVSLKKKDDKFNGHIERIQDIDNQPIKIMAKRSVIDAGNDDLESGDLVGAEAKVFRPLFVYRQQMNRRKAQKIKKKKFYPKKYEPKMTMKPMPYYYYPNMVHY